MYRLLKQSINKTKTLSFVNRLKVSNDGERQQLLRYLDKDKESNVYQELISENRYISELKEDIETKYMKEEVEETVELQRKKLLGDNWSLFKGARHLLEVEGLATGEESVLEHLEERGRVIGQRQKVDYQVRGKLARHKEGMHHLSDRRQVRLQKIKQLDYLDHQYSENQQLFKYRYSSIDDHFSRFIKDEEYKVELEKNQVGVVVEQKDTVGSVYQDLMKAGVEGRVAQIDLLYDVLNRPAIAIVTLQHTQHIHSDIQLIRQQLGDKVIKGINEEQLDSRHKTVVIQNIEVEHSLQTITKQLASYGRVMRVEVAQVVARPNRPSQPQVEAYLQKTQVDTTTTNIILQGEDQVNQVTKHIPYQHQVSIPQPHQSGVEHHMEDYFHQKNHHFQQKSVDYMKKHLKENIFPFDYKSEENEDRWIMEQHLRGEKDMNNLGYVIVEFSQMDEAKGCLVALGLQSPHLPVDLASMSPHLTSDPFYFYNKLKQVNHLVDTHHSQQLAKQPDTDPSLETITIEDIFKQEMLQFIGGSITLPSDHKVVEAYLEEKQFNDSQQFNNQLHQYMQEEQSVGRQTMQLSNQSIYNTHRNIINHIEDQQEHHHQQLDRLEEQQAEIKPEEEYQLLKTTYDYSLYQLLKGDYEEELLLSLFKEQQEPQVKKRMYDYLEHIQLDGNPFIKENEIRRLLHNNYTNGLFNHFYHKSQEQWVEDFFWKQRVCQNMQDHKIKSLNDFSQAMQEQILGKDDLLVMPQEFYEVEDGQSREELQEMVDKLNRHPVDHSTHYEVLQQQGKWIVVKTIKDVNKPDINSLLAVDTLQLKQQVNQQIQQAGFNLDIDQVDLQQLITHLDINNIDLESIQEVAQELNLNPKDVEKLLLDEISQEQIEQYLKQEQAAFNTRELKPSDFIQNVDGPNIKDENDSFRKSRYKLI